MSPILTLGPKTTYGSTVTFLPNDVSLDKKIVSGAIKLTYGSFGTGSLAGAAVDDFNSEADLDIAASSSSGSISMTGSLELDESGEDAGPVTISTGALTFTYDTNDMGALAVAPTDASGGDGESDSYGDYSVAFAAGGIGVTYVKDQESSDNAEAVTYSAGAFSLTTPGFG